MPTCVLLLALLISLPLNAEPTMPDEITLIADRLRERVLSRIPDDIDQQTQQRLDRQNDDGSWDDVDYDDESRTHWKPGRHLSHLETLSRAYRAPSSGFTGDNRVADAIRSGLSYWIDRHPVSDNWWYDVIGGPRQLGDILILMVDELTPELIDGASKLMHESGFTRTGANLVDEASNLLYLACATRDAELLTECVKYISGEIRVTTDEGIQADDSFHQHGPQQMVISYGRGFAADQAGFAVLFAGTSFAFPEEKIRILSRFILDAQQWFIRGRQVDYHAMGRGAFRGAPGEHTWNAGGYAWIAERMIEVDPARADEYRAFADRVRGKTPAGSTGPLGNKHFWRSDTMVHREPDWYASVRFHSTRVYATETRTNRENLKGYHLADGTYFVLQRGDEYHEVQPVWNYRRLPGLTYLDTEAPIPYGRDVPQAGNTEFVGGVSDGLYGAAVMDYDKAGVSARKSYFFFPDGFVCLGAGIGSTEPERVLTTLNQSRRRSDISVFGEGLSVLGAEGIASSDRIRAIQHDGIAYVLLDPATVGISARRQEGSWQEVEDRASDEPVPQDIFTAWIDHGPKPDDATYAYRIVPGAEPGELAKHVGESPVRILSNTPEVQAVETRDGVTQAIFYRPGSIRLSDDTTITVDAPCTLIWRLSGEEVLLTVSDPLQTRRQIGVRISGSYAGLGAGLLDTDTQVIVDLPGDQNAGRSRVTPLRLLR